LVLRLIKVNPEQWSVNSFYGKDLTAQRLGRLVNKAFGINSKRVGDSARGYHSKQFERIWRQLGIARQVVDGTDGTDGTDGGAK